MFFCHSAALEVELSDDSFPPEDFGIVSGMLNVKWERIAPYPPVEELISIKVTLHVPIDRALDMFLKPEIN